MNFRILFTFALLVTLFSCTKKEQEEITFVIDQADFDNLIIFKHDGNTLSSEYTGIDDLYQYKFKVSGTSAEIDYTFSYQGITYSSLSGATTIKSPSVRLKTETFYELRPQADFDEPLLVIDYTVNNGGNGSNSNSIDGIWERGSGASSLKFSGSRVSLCNHSTYQEFTGTYDSSAGEATLTEGSTTLTFYITKVDNSTLLIEQYVSNSHVGSTNYYKSNNYPCQ